MREPDPITPRVRAAVLERDGNGCCRVCGRHAGDPPALHHVRYRSEGGPSTVDNLVTIGWSYGHNCHQIVHSNKRLWQPALLVILDHPGINAQQLLRWHYARRVHI